MVIDEYKQADNVKQDKQFLYGINPKYKNQENTLLEMFGKCDSFNKNIKITNDSSSSSSSTIESEIESKE